MATGHVATGNVMPYTNATGTLIAKDTVIVFGAMIGITLGAIANGATGELAIAEVWTLPKDGALAITQGDQLYWDAVNDECDKTNTNVPCGKAFATAAEAATEVQVILNK
jgi:predicted RecA/RadA family phage recombinase